MAHPSAYRKSGQATGIWVTCCILGVVLFYTGIFWLIGSRLDRVLGPWMMPIAFVPLVLGVVTGWIMIARKNRERLGLISQRTDRLGFSMTAKPTESEREQFAVPIVHLFPAHGIRQGAAGIQWFAQEKTGASKILLCEHEFVTGSGKYTQVHQYTLLAWPVGHPDLHGAPGLPQAPWFFMGRFGRLLRRGYRKEALNLPEFADLALVWTLIGDAGTGARFLTPAVRELLASSPKNEAWSVGAGWICCVFKGALDADNLERFLAHTRGVLAAARA